MKKATITRLFLASVIAVIAGVLLCVAAFVAAYAGGALQMSGPDVIGINGNASAWTMIGLGIVGVLAMAGGAIGGLVAWIGALINTAQLVDKTWFILLLVLGLLSFGLVAMIAYIIAGPDGTRVSANRSTEGFRAGGAHA